MENQNNKQFTTDSFLLASYLLAESCTLLSLDKTNPKRVIFVFKESDERKHLTEKFLAHRGLIEPHRFYAGQKDIKQLLYQNQ